MDRVTIPDVLTLEEASSYLRLSIETVASQALKGNIPGRKIENDWRFLKSAIDDWLRSKNSSSILLAQAGALADDDSLGKLGRLGLSNTIDIFHYTRQYRSKLPSQ